jgi:hypothetical protein
MAAASKCSNAAKVRFGFNKYLTKVKRLNQSIALTLSALDPAWPGAYAHFPRCGKADGGRLHHGGEDAGVYPDPDGDGVCVVEGSTWRRSGGSRAAPRRRRRLRW